MEVLIIYRCYSEICYSVIILLQFLIHKVEMLQLASFQTANHVTFARTYTGHQNSKISVVLNFMKVETRLSSNDFVDRRLVRSFTAEGMKDFIRLALQCISFPGKRRPKMEMVLSELDRILEKEITLTTVMGEGSTTVTPGSQLFTSEIR